MNLLIFIFRSMKDVDDKKPKNADLFSDFKMKDK